MKGIKLSAQRTLIGFSYLKSLSIVVPYNTEIHLFYALFIKYTVTTHVETISVRPSVCDVQ